MKNVLKILPLLALWSIMLPGCDFDPELNLISKTQDVVIEMPLVITDLKTVWDTEVDWDTEWLYGWDEQDLQLWGELEYPEPHIFQIRHYFMGSEPGASDYLTYDAFETFEPKFSRRYEFGYHNLILYSDIESADGTQVLYIDESDPGNIVATTTRARMRNRSITRTLNHPDIFYSAHVKDVHITDNPADYDFYDEAKQLWVKKLDIELHPMVFIYLVQVVLHNNNGRVTELVEYSTLSGLSEAVSLHSMRTSENDASMAFPMRIKKGVTTDSGEIVDVIGGKLHTFGLCDIDVWTKGRKKPANISRTDINNKLSVNLRFYNGAEKIVEFDVTDQARNNIHGGVLTVHLDVNTIEIPTISGGSIFDATIDDSTEEVTFNVKL